MLADRLATLRLETPRLRLRPFQRQDFPAYLAMWSDPEVTRFIGGKPFSRAEAWSRFVRLAGFWQMLGFGTFGVWDAATGAHLGEVGFHDMKRDLTPNLDGTMETGWSFRPEAHGRGIATEAVTALLAWADARSHDKRITCFIDPDNQASLRVAEKTGFHEFARTRYEGRTMILFERGA